MGPAPAVLAAAAVVFHPPFETVFDLLRGDILDVGGDYPFESEGIDELTDAVAPELVGDGLLLGGAGLDGFRERGVHVLHVDHQ